MSLSVTVLGESHCFSDFPGPAGVPAENSSRVGSPAAPGGTTRQPVPEARWRICSSNMDCTVCIGAVIQLKYGSYGP